MVRRGHSLSPATVRFVCTIAIVTPPMIVYPSLDPRPGKTARTVPFLDILEIVCRYNYRYNIRHRVVTPLQDSRHRRASWISLYVYRNFSAFLSPPTSF
jgi:hypothetical protein